MGKPDQGYSLRARARREKSVLLARMAVLVVATGALLVYGALQALPRITGARTVTSAAAAAPELTVSLSGRLDETGSLTEDVQVVSEDGLAVLSLGTGTRVLDAQGQPLADITVRARRLPLRIDTGWVGKAYELGPAGATLDPPAPFTMSYDPTAPYPFSYQDIDTRRVYLAYLGQKGPLRPAMASGDGKAGSVSAKIDRLGTLVLYCEVHTIPLS